VSRQLLVSIQHFNTARRYARAAFAVVYPSVCPSVTSRYCIETTGQIELGFGMEAFSPLSHRKLGNPPCFSLSVLFAKALLLFSLRHM